MTAKTTNTPTCAHRTHCEGTDATQELHGEPLCDTCFQSFDRWVEDEACRSLDRQSGMQPHPRPQPYPEAA